MPRILLSGNCFFKAEGAKNFFLIPFKKTSLALLFEIKKGTTTSGFNPGNEVESTT